MRCGPTTVAAIPMTIRAAVASSGNSLLISHGTGAVIGDAAQRDGRLAPLAQVADFDARLATTRPPTIVRTRLG